MPVPKKNNQNESVLSLSRSQLTKKKGKVSNPVKCQCDKCDQIAIVEPDQTHAFCRGFKINKPLPMMFQNLHKEKGTWRVWTKPVEKVETPIIAETPAPEVPTA